MERQCVSRQVGAAQRFSGEGDIHRYGEALKVFFLSGMANSYLGVVRGSSGSPPMHVSPLQWVLVTRKDKAPAQIAIPIFALSHWP